MIIIPIRIICSEQFILAQGDNAEGMRKKPHSVWGPLEQLGPILFIICLVATLRRKVRLYRLLARLRGENTKYAPLV
jgi:hypothetical protein